MENRKQKKIEKSSSLQGDACFHGNAEHVLVCMMTSCMHFLLGSLLFCQDADRQCVCLHKAHGAVTCQAPDYVKKREKSTSSNLPARIVIILTTHSLGSDTFKQGFQC